MKPLVVPEESERCTTWMARSGRVAPELRAAILGSFHFLMVPRKMPARVSESSLSEATPDTLYAATMAPNTVGMCSTLAPAFAASAAAISVSFMGASLAPKSTVILVNWVMPPPEPTAW